MVTAGILLSIAILGACSGGPPRDVSTPTPKGPDREAWAKARAIAEEYLRARHAATDWKIVEERAGMPFLFSVETPDAFAVLVSGGAVVTQRGLDALDQFLRQSRCMEARTPTVDEMMVLVQLLDVFPGNPQPRNFMRRWAETVAWRPRLDFLDHGRAALYLYYALSTLGDDPDHHRSPSAPASRDTTEIIEWKLAMDPGQPPVWTQKRRTFDKVNQKWADVDHP
jgi:hypothetical protein